jgi:hypothetical protein
MAGASLVIEGKIEVNGSTSLPVYFTSFLDDSVGGDTNEDRDDRIICGDTESFTTDEY